MIKMVRTLLLKEFLKDKKVGSIKSSSKFLVKAICDRIDFNGNKLIVEYGPGTGVLTKAILKKMNFKSKFIIIETNKKFVSALEMINDKRLIIINDSAENIEKIMRNLGINKADYVISGIPFSFLKNASKEKIITGTKKILLDKGYFFVYQVRKIIEKDLKKYFSKIKKHYEVRNIPPLIIFECEK